jgi:hypothetical protein
MKTTTRKARQEGKARKFTPSVKRWAYPYQDGHIVTDVPPLTEDLKAGWCKAVAIFDLNEQADAARIEAGARAMYYRYYSRPQMQVKGMAKGAYNWESEPNWLKDDYKHQARALLSAIGALSTPGKKE